MAHARRRVSGFLQQWTRDGELNMHKTTAPRQVKMETEYRTNEGARQSGNGYLVPEEIPVEDVPDRPREHLIIKVAETKLAVPLRPRPVHGHILETLRFPSPLLPRALTISITHLSPLSFALDLGSSRMMNDERGRRRDGRRCKGRWICLVDGGQGSK